MPRADCSLRDYLSAKGGVLSIDEALVVLSDIAAALTDLDMQQVVHRDLKPENVLLLNGAWSLADFGISRYAEATTAADTRKFALTWAYAAPERWRHERTTAATDVYALGVVGFEMLSSERPFQGPSEADFREQHLHGQSPSLAVPLRISSVIEECMFKAPEARPSPSNLAARLATASAVADSPALSKLQEAQHADVKRRAQIARQASHAATEAETTRRSCRRRRRHLACHHSRATRVSADSRTGGEVHAIAQGRSRLEVGARKR